MDIYDFSDPNNDNDILSFSHDNTPNYHPLRGQSEDNILFFYKCYYICLLILLQDQRRFGLAQVDNIRLHYLAERMGSVFYFHVYRPNMAFGGYVPSRSPNDHLPHELLILLDESHLAN